MKKRGEFPSLLFGIIDLYSVLWYNFSVQRKEVTGMDKVISIIVPVYNVEEFWMNVSKAL